MGLASVKIQQSLLEKVEIKSKIPTLFPCGWQIPGRDSSILLERVSFDNRLGSKCPTKNCLRKETEVSCDKRKEKLRGNGF